MRYKLTYLLSVVLINIGFNQSNKPVEYNAELFNALQFRSIGPAVTSGRVGDLAINPNNHSEYYVAVASGGVWKTINRGTSYYPIFDHQGSYSIGCVTIDPNNTNTIWVGTGENNNQRSVAYGDGVYKSEDGGKTWKNKGLKNSEHIGKIIVDPSNSNIVYVAAYGPVWKEGGERGLYKTTDGGENWTLIKSVSQYTGCNEVLMDPRDPKILYAAFHQRMRKVFTYIGGGPESALFKSTDGGSSWKQLNGGLPSGDLGRIGIAISPVNPDIIFAVVEARDNGGIYRSINRGNSWEKRSGFATSGNYYQEIWCDPVDVDRIFISDTYFKVSHDGGKTVGNLGELNKHVDNHAIWIDPKDNNHLLVGCDGGIYETFDFARSWDFKANLPITQFYKVSTDNASPFYHVHGGTQDNMSLGGPSRNISGNGVSNDDWYATSTGDGFETQVDQTNPDIIYAQSQYGGLVRFDRKSGEMLFIKPIEGENDPAVRWNWDSPLLISQFDNKRLYFGSNKIWRTDDRGNNWKLISPDLSRKLDRNKFEVMGRVWSMDAVAKNQSTDIYGQTTTIAESKFDENIIWVGTDDGLIQLTLDGGKSWTAIDNIVGIPKHSYVHQIITSLHDKNTAYACFNHHRYGDFKPYVVKTTDGGKTWNSISNKLPERGSVYSIAEDHIDKNLLFIGTEFGLHFSNDGGVNWYSLKNGLPTIAVRDIEIQRRENDLVLATFGRGFYILDDYSLLRNCKKEDLTKEAMIYPVKEALMYNQSLRNGLRGNGHLGSSYYAAKNPEPNATIYYFIKDEIKKLKTIRKDFEKSKIEKKESVYYPSLDSIRLEDNQEDPFLIFTIKDESGKIVRHLKTSISRGLNKIEWNLRGPIPDPINQRYTPEPDQLFSSEQVGHFVNPGMYTISIAKVVDGIYTNLGNSQTFNVRKLENSSIPLADFKENVAFYQKVDKLIKSVSATNDISGTLKQRLANIKLAVNDMNQPVGNILLRASKLNEKLLSTLILLQGDGSAARREFETKTSITDRAYSLTGALYGTSSDIPGMYIDSYEIASRQLKLVLVSLREINTGIEGLEKELEINNAPYTPGRWPE
ncbi:MAG: glycosyl hydrolase [Saprospiraceae bacterium]|nr:glycosyl hydrolase [Saprospiraceae bacterium]